MSSTPRPSTRITLGIALLTSLLCVFATAHSDESVPSAVVLSVARMIPGVEPESIQPSPIPGLYEVVFGPHVVYVTEDGEYMVRGDVVHIDTRTNLTEEKRNGARISAIDKLGEDTMIVFAPQITKYTVTVFTDVDCVYCAKLHQEMPALHELGIKVRYLAFPRGGLLTGTYQKMVSVWCADDTKDAITKAKIHRQVELKKCANPVKDHYNMGRLVGVNGTPTLILENGDLHHGYLPPDELVRALSGGSG